MFHAASELHEDLGEIPLRRSESGGGIVVRSKGRRLYRECGRSETEKRGDDSEVTDS